MAKKLGVTLPLQRGANGYFNGTDDPGIQIRSNLTNLLLTQVGERLMQPEFGSELLTYVFEAATDEGLAGIQATIEAAAEKWMPFLRIGNVVVSILPETHQVAVRVPFTLITTNVTDSITLVF